MAVSAVLVPAAFAGSAEPKAPPAVAKLGFEDERTLKVGWQRLATGPELEVCNTGDKEGTFQPRLVAFDFEINDKPAQSVDVARIEPANVTVEAGKCAPLAITARTQVPRRRRLHGRSRLADANDPSPPRGRDHGAEGE